MIRSRLLRVILTVFVFLAGSLACSRQQPDELSIRLKWIHQAQFAGFYYAQETGLYAAKGVTVSLRPGGVDYPAIKRVASGSDHFGVAGADQILIARGNGIPIVAVACIYRKSPFVLFALSGSGINSVEDLRGKRVGVLLGGSEELVYRAMLRKAGLTSADVNEIPVELDITPLLTGQIDVWPGYSINEPITLEDQGHQVTLIWPEDYGIHVYSDVLFTTEEMIRTNPQIVRDVVDATVKGWEGAFSDRNSAVEFTLTYSDQLREDHERKMLDASAELVMPDQKPIGWMEREAWENLHQLLRTSGFLKEDVDIDQAFSIDFLPGVGQ